MIAAIALLIFTCLYGLLASVPQFAEHSLARGLSPGPGGTVRVSVEADPPIRAGLGSVDRVYLEVASGSIRGIPVSYLALETASFSYDPLALALRHQMVLRNDLKAAIKLSIGESGLTAILKSKAVRDRFRGIPTPAALAPGFVDARLDVVPLKAHLVENLVEILGQVQVPAVGLVLPFTFSARPVLLSGQRIGVEDPSVLIMGNRLHLDQLPGAAAMAVMDLGSLSDQGIKVNLASVGVTGGLLSLSGSALLSPKALQSMR